MFVCHKYFFAAIGAIENMICVLRLKAFHALRFQSLKLSNRNAKINQVFKQKKSCYNYHLKGFLTQTALHYLKMLY